MAVGTASDCATGTARYGTRRVLLVVAPLPMREGGAEALWIALSNYYPITDMRGTE